MWGLHEQEGCTHLSHGAAGSSLLRRHLACRTQRTDQQPSSVSGEGGREGRLRRPGFLSPWRWHTLHRRCPISPAGISSPVPREAPRRAQRSGGSSRRPLILKLGYMGPDSSFTRSRSRCCEKVCVRWRVSMRTKSEGSVSGLSVKLRFSFPIPCHLSSFWKGVHSVRFVLCKKDGH